MVCSYSGEVSSSSDQSALGFPPVQAEWASCLTCTRPPILGSGGLNGDLGVVTSDIIGSEESQGLLVSSGRAEGSRGGADMRGPSGSEIGSSVGLSVCAVSCGSPMG